MFDPLRTDPSRALDAASDLDRDAKIEQLLLDGLDRYFAEQYEQAINVWTRALFLDRSHARARAYIERARRALAERQRESEEMLHSGMAAFDRGEADEARRLLQQAIERGAPAEEALAILGRLDRTEPRTTVTAPVATAAGERRPLRAPLFLPKHQRTSRSNLLVLLVALAITGTAWVLMSGDVEWQSPVTFAPPASPAVAPRAAGLTPPIPRRGEVALAQARALAASGRLHDAIAALDGVRPTDPQNAEADQLRADLQRQLIALTVSAEGSAADRPNAEERAP